MHGRQSKMAAASVPWLLALLASALAYDRGLQPPEVRVGQTRVLGSWMASYGGRAFEAYRGIPYARPPVGALRFRDPVPMDLPPGFLNATSDAPQCPQENFLAVPPKLLGQEDCLYLNVYRHPKLWKLPVIVFIHHGGWFAGSGVSDRVSPKFFMQKDVVFVTFNYRLNVMGYLCVDSEEAPCNAGLKDQVAVLRWVRDHIAAFGGDPGCVTIYGQAAGSASVHLHMLSPMSAGLFHRAIGDSGNALAAWALPTEDPAGLARRHAALVGCEASPSTSTRRMLACLRGVDATHLVNATSQLKYWWAEPAIVYRPVVETWGSWEQRFLPMAPLDIIKKALTEPGTTASFTTIPWLHGIVSQEGIFKIIPILSTPKLRAELNSRMDELMQVILELPRSVGNRSLETWYRIKEFYFPGRRHVALGEDTAKQFIDLAGDRFMIFPVHKAALYQRMAGHKNIFLFSFEYRGMHSYTTFFGDAKKNYGVSHCDELLYLLPRPVSFPRFPKDSPDWDVVHSLLDLWVNFSTYGHPTPPKLRSHGYRRHGSCADSVDDVWWPTTLDTRSLPYLQIAANEKRNVTGKGGVLKFCMQDDLLPERMAFWDSLPLKENIHHNQHLWPAEGL